MLFLSFLVFLAYKQLTIPKTAKLSSLYIPTLSLFLLNNKQRKELTTSSTPSYVPIEMSNKLLSFLI